MSRASRCRDTRGSVWVAGTLSSVPPTQCSPENNLPWERSGYHILDLGRALFAPCILLPASSGISNTSLPVHAECPVPALACVFFFISDNILSSKR